MRFNIKIAKTDEEKVIDLKSQTKEEALAAFNKIPWESVIKDLDFNEYSLEDQSLSFGIDNPSNGYGIIVSPTSEKEWLLYVKKPVVADNCNEKISFKTESFKKHCNSEFTNLSINENDHFEIFIRANHLTKLSFLDFRCPSCHQPTKILFDGGPSGYWGEFYFEIKAALIFEEK